MDLAAKALGDLGRCAGYTTQAPDVEERLVDGDPLDERGGVVEHLEHRLAGRRVRRQARRDEDGVRAQPTRLAAAHRAAHPAGPRLVAGAHHDANADDHRPAAQPRVVALLDGGEERIEVGVQDRRITGHERMFA